MTERLRLDSLTKYFGGLIVAAGIDLVVSEGERTALIGPNGAGKTTLVNLISGALTATSGHIYLDGEPVDALGQAARVRAGIVRTFQISRLCRDLTVIENVSLALIQRHQAAFRMWPSRHEDRAIRSEAEVALASLGLAGAAERRVSELAYGEQRLVEMAIAIALKPRVLLLDEPAAGVPESGSGVILDALTGLPRELPILLIEHDMDLVFRFARRVIVLVAGSVLLDGTPIEASSSDVVRDIYFGRTSHGSVVV
jgi:branched-chain amino acid transport system ATP-binding protein